MGDAKRGLTASHAAGHILPPLTSGERAKIFKFVRREWAQRAFVGCEKSERHLPRPRVRVRGAMNGDRDRRDRPVAALSPPLHNRTHPPASTSYVMDKRNKVS